MSKSKQFELSAACFARELRIGCIRLGSADSLPLASAFVDLSKTEASITFWGATPEPWNGTSLVSINMYWLPASRAEFRRMIKWFSDVQKNRARLPDGVAFEETTLAVHRVPAGWVHEGFARSGRDFIHIYRSRDRAILMRFLGKAGTILDNPLLAQVHKNLRIVDNQWIVDFPKTKPRKRAQSPITDTAPAPEIAAQLEEAASRAREFLNLGRVRDPSKTAKAIDQAINEIRSRSRLPADKRKQLAIDLGALWGNALCQAKQWEWCCIRPTAEEQIFAIVSSNRSHAIDPIRLVFNLLSSRQVASNSLLLFNMIVSGRQPETSDRAYCWLS